MPRKKKKPINLKDKLKQRKETITNFYVNRLSQVSDDPQKVWELTKDPTNMFRTNEEELTNILAELDRRVLVGEIDPQVRTKIIQGINYQ
ncbi:hypothetical protein [Crocosphaera sp. Alani8]|uniref:hypothetical protein n=1 Tax=Crocosphaera sp. Alani8 TaxID=3038952 RepID=UPI00313C7387